MIRFKSQLEKCRDKGWLGFGDKRIHPLDRFQAGQRLFADFTKSAFPSAKAVNFEADRVDGGNMKEMPESVAMARQRFNEAIRSIENYWEWFMVREIVLNDRKVGIKKTTVQQYRHEMEMMKEDLCRGLDQLAYHYGITHAKPEIKGCQFIEVDFMDMPTKYEIER